MNPHGNLSSLSGLMQPIMAFVGNLGYAGVAISGGLLAIRGTIGVGGISGIYSVCKELYTANPADCSGYQSVTVHEQQLPREYLNSWRSRKKIRTRESGIC